MAGLILAHVALVFSIAALPFTFLRAKIEYRYPFHGYDTRNGTVYASLSLLDHPVTRATQILTIVSVTITLLLLHTVRYPKPLCGRRNSGFTITFGCLSMMFQLFSLLLPQIMAPETLNDTEHLVALLLKLDSDIAVSVGQVTHVSVKWRHFREIGDSCALTNVVVLTVLLILAIVGLRNTSKTDHSPEESDSADEATEEEA